MAFSTKFADNASKKIESKSALADYKIIEPILKKAVATVSSVWPYFKPEDVEIYMQGSYSTGTNIAFQSKLEVAVEIKKTTEFSAEKMTAKDFIIFDNFYIAFNHTFDPKKFREALITSIEAELKHKVRERPVNFVIPAFGELQHDIDICPCFSYKYFSERGGKINCKLVYNGELDENYLMFINLHVENGKLKDTITKGKFKEVVRLFKTIVSMSRREDDAIKYVRGYYIECMLYNVPNEMYLTADGTVLSAFLKVLNWLNFCDPSNFVCQNEIWSLWGGADGFWQPSHAQKLINDVITYYNNFPLDRDDIVQ
jgi:hypothetical protein